MLPICSRCRCNRFASVPDNLPDLARGDVRALPLFVSRDLERRPPAGLPEGPSQELAFFWRASPRASPRVRATFSHTHHTHGRGCKTGDLAVNSNNERTRIFRGGRLANLLVAIGRACAAAIQRYLCCRLVKRPGGAAPQRAPSAPPARAPLMRLICRPHWRRVKSVMPRATPTLSTAVDLSLTSERNGFLFLTFL